MTRGESRPGTIFVGRGTEVAVLEDALRHPDSPLRVLYVFGPPGIGKSRLLDAYAAVGDRAELELTRLDGRTLEPTVDDVANALRAAGAEHGGRRVVLIDDFYLLKPVERWVRGTWLPALASGTVVVLASRSRPGPLWKGDGAAGIHLLRLGPLPDAEVRRYVRAQGVAGDRAEEVVAFAQGHPLAMRLACGVVERAPTRPLRIDDLGTDLLEGTLGELLDPLDDPARRRAVEIAAIAGTIDEDMLADMLPTGGDAPGLFEWLRSSALFDASPRGLTMQELTRSIVVAELRWRNPVRYAALVERARRHHHQDLRCARGRPLSRVLASYLDLARANAPDPPAGAPPDIELSLGPARATDAAMLTAAAGALDGPAAAVAVGRELDAKPESVRVLRVRDGEPAGFLLVHAAAALERRRPIDPMVRAALGDGGAALRAGEQATFVTSWGECSGSRARSATTTLVLLALLLDEARSSAVTYFALERVHEPGWRAALVRAGAELVGAIGGGDRGRSLWRCDWRFAPPGAWLDGLAGFEPLQPANWQAGPAGRPLDRAEFDEAVRRALRELPDAAALRENPLTRSRLVLSRAGAEPAPLEPAEALRALILEAASSLQSSPRRMKLFRALSRTYFDAAPTQEQASEMLGLPFSTYRRHLRAAVRHVTDLLWRKEINGAAPPAYSGDTSVRPTSEP